MTPAERREREEAAIFKAGWDNAASFPPLTTQQIKVIAPLIRPTVAAVPRTRTAVELPAAA